EPDPMLIARPLARCDSLLVASPAYLDSHGTPQAPQDLKQHRCLSHANFGKSVWHLGRGAESTQVSVVSRFSANDATALLKAAMAGGGIAMLPTYLVNPVVATGELSAVLPDWQAPVVTIYALYPSRRNLSPAVRALLDYLVQRFETLPW
ncbi:MAG: substrate binding domain-containing protein, partial [Rhodoferax sp.]